jgi:hypothetical protein
MIDDLLNTDSQDHQELGPVGCGHAMLGGQLWAAHRPSALAAVQ